MGVCYVPIYQIVCMHGLEDEEVSELHLIQSLWLFFQTVWTTIFKKIIQLIFLKK